VYDAHARQRFDETMKSIVETQTPPSDAQPEIRPLRAIRIKPLWLAHLVNFSPFVVLVWFVSRFGVNVPEVDEWFLAFLFHAVRFGRATVGDFFALANEHRIAVPRAIWTPLAFATHWNLRVEMLVNLVAPLIIFTVFYVLALRQTKHMGHGLAWLANFSMSLLVFSLVQLGVWLWGLAGGHVITDAAFALAVGVCFLARLGAWSRLALAALCCFAASFSQAWGLASWMALVPCVVLLASGKEKWSMLLAWLAAFIGTAGLYFYHFHFMQSAGSPVGFLSHPLHSAAFFVALLGTSFCQIGGAEVSVPLAFVTGAVVLAVLGACLVTLRRYERRDVIAPWVSVALFGLLFAAMVTAGRGNWGYETAVQSRYATGTLFVAVAALQLGRVATREKGRQIYLLLVGAMWALLLAGSVVAVSTAQHLKDELSRAKLFLEVVRYIDRATDSSSEGVFFPLYPAEGTGNIRTASELLDQVGFRHLASGVAFEDHPSAEYGSFESAEGSGDLLHLRRSKDEVTVSGWASLPGGRGLPKIVLISCGEQKTFITGAWVGRMERPDVAALRREARYFHAGWKVSFPTEFLPPGPGVLKAWVYDAAEKKFLRMPEAGGEKHFNVESE
jgi:hypothetical protein